MRLCILQYLNRYVVEDELVEVITGSRNNE